MKNLGIAILSGGSARKPRPGRRRQRAAVAAALALESRGHIDRGVSPWYANEKRMQPRRGDGRWSACRRPCGAFDAMGWLQTRGWRPCLHAAAPPGLGLLAFLDLDRYTGGIPLAGEDASGP